MFNNNSGGYTYSQIFYVDGKGWGYASQGKDISSALKTWYDPFREKKIK